MEEKKFNSYDYESLGTQIIGSLFPLCGVGCWSGPIHDEQLDFDKKWWEFVKRSSKSIPDLDLGYDYDKILNKTNYTLKDIVGVNWGGSYKDGLDSLLILYKEFYKEYYKDLEYHNCGKNLKKNIFDIENDDLPMRPKESEKVEKKEKEVKKEAASDSIAKGMKNMQVKSMKNKQTQSNQNEDIPQRITFSGFNQPQQNAASFNTQPHFTNERDLWMFELGRRQVLGENYHGPLSPQQYQLAMQQYDQSEHLSTASVKNESNLPPKIVTQEEMVSCIKEYASRFPDIYGEKFVTEIMENDTCTLKGHGHDYIKMYQACHGADAVSDGKLTNRIILEIDWLYSYKEFMADIGELFVEYTLKHMPYSEKFMKNDN